MISVSPSAILLAAKRSGIFAFCAWNGFFCAEIVDGPIGLDIYYALFYTTVPLRMRSVKGLVKFLALRILLSENHIKDFPF